MKLLSGPEMKIDSDFEIKSVQPTLWGVHKGVAHSYLTVSLQPSIQQRNRGFGDSFEYKKYPAALQIDYSELQQMISAVTEELNTCYQILVEHNL